MKTPSKRSSSRGSHATWSEGDSRTCLHCGKQLRITVDPAIWIHTDHLTGVHTSTHAACGPPWKEHTMNTSETTTTTETTTETTVDPQPEPVPAPPDPEPDNDDDDEAE
jgi:hypothetical protein